MSKLGEGIVTVLLAIVGVAVVALLVSKQANTSQVITAGATGFSGALGTALSPVTGSTGSGLDSPISFQAPMLYNPALGI